MQEIFLKNIKNLPWSIKCLFIVSLLGLRFLPQQESILGGLKFHGSEQPIDQRTSYNVFGENEVGFQDNFALEFDLSLYQTTEIGYIFRIKNRESNKIYNLFYNGEGDDLVFKFNEEGTNNLIVANLDRELLNQQWFKMKVEFDLKEKLINLIIGEQSFSTKNTLLPDRYYPVILFGKSDHLIDVPSFAIKDLFVGNEDKYNFPLTEINGNTVFEGTEKAIGEVSNPEWLMNDAYHWTFKKSFKSEMVAGANYNSEKKEIYYFNRDSILIYDVRSGESVTRVFDEKCPVQLKLGTNFLDTANNLLYAYEVYYDTPYEGPTVARLDLSTYNWTMENHGQLPTQLHHHGSYFDSSNEEYTLFGGFGNMYYSNSFFKYDLSEREWNAFEGFTGDFISPRYFASIGYLSETNSIYIFGGMGNESGEQAVGRRYYYDLYKVDLNKKHISKLWEIPWENDNMVPVRGMVILDESHFYTLCYPEHFSESTLKLHRFSLKDGSYEVLGDSIPIYSDKITTNANLYYDGGLNNLYAAVQEFDDDISSELKIYSLAFPPITSQELASFNRSKRNNMPLLIIICVFVAAGVIFLFFKKFRPLPSRKQDNMSHVPIPAEINIKERKPRPNSIYLFGEFTVRDRNNRDITYMFSSQLKQILCLIIQYSVEEEGISSQKLSHILWPDKPADKVKNSRGVTINNLRKALSELDGIELVYEKGHFKIIYGDGVYFDYFHCIELISSPERHESGENLVGIVERGKFLQLTDHPLFDSFKEEMEKKLEPFLLIELEKSYGQEHYRDTISLAEALFNIDPLNESALDFQVNALKKLRLYEEAKIKFMSFSIEYKKVMGNDYPHHLKS